MRLRILRIRLRTLMAVVAIVAVGLGVDDTRRRREDYLSREQYHAARNAKFKLCLKCEGYTGWGPEEMSWLRRWIAWDGAMACKYRRAARYPFLPVPPDPPEPK